MMVQQQSNRTPSPWRVAHNTDDYVDELDEDDLALRYVSGIMADERTIVSTDGGYYGPNEADAEFIVRACNAHDDLLAAAKQGLDYLIDQEGTDDTEEIRVLRAAIAKAKATPVSAGDVA